MVFTDWTVSWGGTTGYTPILDGTTKYAGNSSLQCSAYTMFAGAYSQATHNTYSDTQCQVIMWVRSSRTDCLLPQTNHSSYGTLTLTNSVNDTWERFRISFWYDTTTNTKWGRVERWNGSSWVQIGGDSNFGVGSPTAGIFRILGYCNSSAVPEVTAYVWFDELEVYS